MGKKLFIFEGEGLIQIRTQFYMLMVDKGTFNEPACSDQWRIYQAEAYTSTISLRMFPFTIIRSWVCILTIWHLKSLEIEFESEAVNRFSVLPVGSLLC